MNRKVSRLRFSLRATLAFTTYVAVVCMGFGVVWWRMPFAVVAILGATSVIIATAGIRAVFETGANRVYYAAFAVAAITYLAPVIVQWNYYGKATASPITSLAEFIRPAHFGFSYDTAVFQRMHTRAVLQSLVSLGIGLAVGQAGRWAFLKWADRSMTPAPKRRWFRFSLRTLFAVVTVAAVGLAYEMNWIRQRHELIAQANASEESRSHSMWDMYGTTMQPIEGNRAPGLLWLFGEKGVRRFTVPVSAPKPDKFNEEDRERILRSQRLFPEAEIVYGHVNQDGILSLYWPDNGPVIYDPLIARPARH
jgi:hypothetical protein